MSTVTTPNFVITVLAYIDPAGINAKVTVSDFQLTQSDQKHDVALVTIRGDNAPMPYYRTGTPIHIRYGWSVVQMDDFYGYVLFSTPVYDHDVISDGGAYRDLVCVGASFPMKDASSEIWSDISSSDVVSKVASDYLLSLLVEGDPTSWSQLTNPGKSRWWFLRSLADRLGWLLACNRTQVRFMSWDQAVKLGTLSMPTFSAMNQGYSGTVSYFKPIHGDSFPTPDGGEYLSDVFATGIDPHTGNIYQSENDFSGTSILGSVADVPVFKSFATDLVSSDLQSLKGKLTGRVQKNRFYRKAKATVNGNTQVVQGSPVRLTNVDSSSDGVWVVLEVVHKFSFQSYTMDLLLGRDSTGDSGVAPTRASAVVWAPNDPLGLRTPVPPTVLVNGLWRASYSSSVTL